MLHKKIYDYEDPQTSSTPMLFIRQVVETAAEADNNCRQQHRGGKDGRAVRNRRAEEGEDRAQFSQGLPKNKSRHYRAVAVE